jgi:hypothetical protein
MVHNRKAIWTIIILLLTLFLLPQGGMAAEVSLELSSNRAMPGNSISALGQAESNTWVSLKILDSQQNIVLFDAVKSDPEGNYQFIFVVPDLPLGSELIVNAGYGNRIGYAAGHNHCCILSYIDYGIVNYNGFTLGSRDIK